MIGFDSFIIKYGYYSIRSLISIYDVELPPEIDSYTESELIPLLRIIMTRFNMRRQKLKTVNTIEDVVDLLKKSNNIIVLTGAGISVSCGIPDFRSENGVYSQLDEFNLDDPQQLFDLEYFKLCPKTFYSFAHELYPSNYEPSLSHKFIKLLEDKGKLLRNYTQNIDTLEQKAGITKMVQCHGSFAAASCIRCGYKVLGNYIEEAVFKKKVPSCPVCPKNLDDAILKPDIVFFGEKLPDKFRKNFQKDKKKCDLLIVMGSSLKVSPVANIIEKIPHNVPQILINLESLIHVPSFDVQLLGYSDSIIKELCRRCDWELGNTEINKDEELKYTLVKPSIYLFEGAKYNQLKSSKITLINALFSGIESDSDDSDEFSNNDNDKNNGIGNNKNQNQSN
ncbi:SIR2-domain-containing protein [Neocallimastix lanati (nom. inval.)]|uniref:SIR2-domain-containing protein n=1 Tax=Neocallimastix californiae TaxID=1754190 RepID=A0A1Y2AEJ2_9FUNG|nr:SIR2-domain-containing protein [Neocallimastix sp. JGI-2020a]ORY20989.1 SIR2-domain-containing protein [Neocallimastix californiae]|eukprot:ORY20989.1 SIR2-domain-containing protein [Neocallimastix californiae]